METETSLSQGIRITDHSSDYDAACKRLLSEKVILAWIMKNCLEEYRNCTITDIMENYIEGDPQVGEVPVSPDETNAALSGSLIRGSRTEDKTLTEGTVTYDIRFDATAPKSGDLLRLIINVEAQADFYPGYPLIKRGLYYCSRMISSQYGTVFTASHYERIKKVISIWVCLNPPKYRENTIAEYSITEKPLVGKVKEAEENYDLMSAIIICLGNPESENYNGILKLLEVLLSSVRTPEEKERILQEDFEIAMTASLEKEVSLMCNLSKGIIEQTTERTQLDAIRNLMETMKLTVWQAMEALKIPKDDQSKYASMLKK